MRGYLRETAVDRLFWGLSLSGAAFGVAGEAGPRGLEAPRRPVARGVPGRFWPCWLAAAGQAARASRLLCLVGSSCRPNHSVMSAPVRLW